MNVHKNARMTVHGRLLLIERVRVAGWRVVDAAAAAGVSERTASTWLARYRAGGERALHDRSSAPARSPRRLPAEIIAAIARLRRQRWSGPRIARALGRPVSTIGAVLRRLGFGRLSALEVKPPVVRYERSAAGELLHIDSKKPSNQPRPGRHQRSGGSFRPRPRDRHDRAGERRRPRNQGNSGSTNGNVPAISSGGRFVAFRSMANNLVPGDTNNHRTSSSTTK